MSSRAHRSFQGRTSSGRSKVSQAAQLTLESLENRRMLSVGGPDTTFGGTGHIVDGFDTSIMAGPTTVQADHKVVSVGVVDNAIAVGRFNADGSRDTGFGSGGLFTRSTGGSINNIAGVELLSDQSIVVAGTSADDTSDIFLLIINPDGSSSTLINPQVPGDQSAAALVVTSNDLTYVVGAGHDVGTGLDNGTLIARFTTSALDTTWGDDGFVCTDISTANDFPDTAHAIALDGDGFVVAGDYLTQTDDAVFFTGIARLDSTGALDTTFGADDTGLVATNFDVLTSMVVKSGKVYVAGNLGTDVVVERYISGVDGGTLDVTFSGDGSAQFSPPSGVDSVSAGDLDIDSAGNVLVSATVGYSDSSTDIAAIRFDANGTVDSTFDGDGISVVNVGESSLVGNVIVDGDKVVLGGANGDFTKFVAARLINAEVVVPPDPVALDGQGNLIVTGTESADTISVTKTAAGTIKVNLNGTVYGPFAVTGRIQISALGGDDTVTVASGITIGADISGGDGNDSLTGGGGNDSINGGNDNDVINGRSGNDTSVGGAGNDHISNALGDDQLSGGTGDDTLLAGGGNDVVHGDDGNDSILGGIGNDSLFGDGDNDTINGGAGDDVIDGGAGNDDLNGQDGSDIVIGGLGNDIVQGAGLRDILIGGAGSDSILGNAEDDVLIAGTTPIDTNTPQLQAALASWNSADPYASRVNTLQSNYFAPSSIVDDDVDTLTGGAGNDWFVYDSNGGTPDVVDKKAVETATDVL